MAAVLRVAAAAAAADYPVAEGRQQVVEGLAEVVGEKRVQDRIHATEMRRDKYPSETSSVLKVTYHQFQVSGGIHV